MKNLLLIAYAYPPISSPGAVRAARMIKSLTEHGWHTSVLTTKDGYSQRIGGLSDPLEDKPENLHRIKDLIAATHNRYIAEEEKAGTNNFIESSKTILKSKLKLLLFPGRDIFWAKSAAKFEPSKDIKLVYSTSPPASSHIAANAISRKYNLPWIAEFRDPLSWLDTKNKASRFRRWRLARYEAWVVKRATAVVVVSETFKDYFESRYPHANIISIPNGAEFDSAKIVETLEKRKNRKALKNQTLRLVHTGSLYNGIRPPKNVIAACKKAMKISDLKFECLFAGNDAHLAVEAAEELGCPNIVKNMGTLPHAETKTLLESADATISLLHREKLGMISIMSKFLDYLPAGAPILNLGGSDYVLSRIITDQGAGGSFEYDDIDGMVNWLIALPEMEAPDTQKLCQDWSAAKMGQSMAKLFDETIANKA